MVDGKDEVEKWMRNDGVVDELRENEKEVDKVEDEEVDAERESGG